MTLAQSGQQEAVRALRPPSNWAQCQELRQTSPRQVTCLLHCWLADEVASALRMTELVLVQATAALTFHNRSALLKLAVRQLSVEPLVCSCEMRRATWLVSVPKRSVLKQMIQVQLIWLASVLRRLVPTQMSQA